MTSPATSPSRSLSAEKASGRSAGAGWHDSTLNDRSASWRTCSHTMVLPIPTSPAIASAAGLPDAAERKAQISAISASRPTSFESTFTPRIGSNRSVHRSPICPISSSLSVSSLLHSVPVRSGAHEKSYKRRSYLQSQV